MMNLTPLIIAVLSLFCCLAAAQQQGYVLPTRYQTVAHFWTADYGTAFQPIYGVGYVWTDYVAGAQRVDELWNLTSLHGTEFEDMLGLISDTHLNLVNTGYYFLSNASGFQCFEIQPSTVLPQHTFADPSTFVGDTVLDGRVVKMFNATIALGKFKTTVELFLDFISGTPYMLHMYPDPTNNIGESYIYYDVFEEVKDPIPSYLLTIPSGCHPSSSSFKKMPSSMSLPGPRVW